MEIRHINPNELSKNPAFTQVVTVQGPAKTIYVGGQDSVDASGNVVGKGDIRAQTVRTLENLQTALEAAGARLEDVVKWNVYIVQGQALLEGYEAFQQVWGNRPNPPAITAAFVSELANPEFLVEIDAIAVVPEADGG
jgi:enamine deaminase RidA (YjgF/YER057c/UK114 family)